jgi:cysteine-rich repeat protein
MPPISAAGGPAYARTMLCPRRSLPGLSLLTLTTLGACSSAEPASTGLGGSTGSGDPTGVVTTTQGSTSEPESLTTGGESTPTGGSLSDTATSDPAPDTDSTASISTTDNSETGVAETGVDPDTDSGSDTTGFPDPPSCGDGTVDRGEECDAGEANADDGACTLACALALCGDGLVQLGVEDCDDANDLDDDLCVGECKLAACGDGFVGPGEACDDGNQVDDDLCGNDCAPTNCGDGKLNANQGETCDDGNQVDTDACLSTCVLASCGDGQVQAGVEACDDGDPDDGDTCTTLCKPPSCDDGIVSGDETDVDCGGDDCSDCEQGESCLVDADCATAACIAGECALPLRCKQIKDAQPAAKDGVYTIDPDGAGDGEPFEVYCDMTVDGGGWTSLVHLTDLSRLNYALEHTQVAVSEATRFWIFADKPSQSYDVFTYNGVPFTNLQAQGPVPTDTGWLWNGVEWNNPAGCHLIQQMILVQSENQVPRSHGNPHYNQGAMFNAALTPAALTTASTIDVAPVVNFPSIHIGCVGWNVLKDPILWVR